MKQKSNNVTKSQPRKRERDRSPRERSIRDVSVPLPELDCPDCGRRFAISAGEVQFFQSRGLQIPKRCKKCRGKNSPETRTAPSMQNKFFRDSDPTRIP